jgi:hypothetical protein
LAGANFIGLVYAQHDNLLLPSLLPIKVRNLCLHICVFHVSFDALDDEDVGGGEEHPGDELEDDSGIGDLVCYFELVVIQVEIVVYSIQIPKLFRICPSLPSQGGRQFSAEDAV